MNKRIGHLVFGANTLCYGLSLCMYKNGIKSEPVTERNVHTFDVVLVSLFWWQHLYDLVDFCEKTKTGKKHGQKPLFICGGFNSANPAALNDYVHIVVVGDGEEKILKAINGENDESFYTGTEKSVAYANADISNNSYVYYNESNIARIEIARGCKYRCKFCKLSHIKKYREVSFDCIKQNLDSVKSKRVVLFAPNKTSHTNWTEIIEALKRSGKQDLCPDVRFNETDKFYSNNHMQIGVEGISERLRHSVGKHFSNEKFKEICKKVISDCKDKRTPCLMLGYILDLPGETDNDWNAFKEQLDDLQSLPGCERLVLFYIFNMFMPEPFTGFENNPINYKTKYQEKIKSVLGYDRKFKVCVRGKLFSRYSRCKSMIATRAGEEFGSIARQITNKMNMHPDMIRIKMLESICGKEMFENYVGVPKIKPWQIVSI